MYDWPRRGAHPPNLTSMHTCVHNVPSPGLTAVQQTQVQEPLLLELTLPSGVFHGLGPERRGQQG